MVNLEKAAIKKKIYYTHVLIFKYIFFFLYSTELLPLALLTRQKTTEGENCIHFSEDMRN